MELKTNMPTIDTSQAPAWFHVSEPEEIKYWRSGLVQRTGAKSFLDVLGVFTTEEIAKECRAAQMKDSYYQIETDTVYQVTREQANEMARRFNAKEVWVCDGEHSRVDSWSVPV